MREISVPYRSRNVDFWEMPPQTQSVRSPETLRAVILLDPGRAAPPEDLLRSLQNRKVQFEVAHSVFAAMAALCGDPAEEPPALIILEPERIAGLDRLRASIARFAPAAPVWKYESDTTPRLQAMPEPKPIPEATPQVVVRPQPKRHAAPALRLTGDFDSLGNLPPNPAPIPGPRSDDDSEVASLLSDEELGMLLTDWSDDDPSPPKPLRRPRGDQP